MSSVKKDLMSQKGSLVSLYVKPRKRWDKFKCSNDAQIRNRKKGLLDSILLDSLHAPKIIYLQRKEEHLRDRWLEKGIGQRLDSI